MKKLLFLFVFCCSATLLSAQQPVSVDEHVSIVFPLKAESQSSEYGNMWFGPFAGDDMSKAMGMAMGIPLSTMQVDSTSIIEHYDDPAFTEGMVKGMLGKLPGVKMVSQKKITKQSRKGYLLELEKSTPDEQFPYKQLYILIVFSGDRAYLQAVYATENVDVGNAKTAFFDSFKVK